MFEALLNILQATEQCPEHVPKQDVLKISPVYQVSVTGIDNNRKLESLWRDVCAPLIDGRSPDKETIDSFVTSVFEAFKR